MAKVQRLSADLANQIAAGEVVERPASVVKELVENALDAGASRVAVEIEHGGLTRIRVTDDGEGMIEDDARLALERHATSKIAKIDDLTRIATFGFRGEALPSIASVARVTLTTRARGEGEGVELAIHGGGAPKMTPAGCAVGTILDVEDLFFNVPARRKFLKSTATESAHVGETVLLAALARPDVTLTLARDGKVAREYLRAGSRAERVAVALGSERLEACRVTRAHVTVEAYLGAPERARAGAVALHLFVNGRPVRDRQLARAVAQAYGSVLEPGRYPVGVVYVEVPPEAVDVNVHPQKAEIRFADGRGTFDAVTRELHACLAKAYAVPDLAYGRGHFTNGARPHSAAPSAPPPSASPGWVFDGRAATAYENRGASHEAGSAENSTANGLDPAPPALAPNEAPGLFTQHGFYARLHFLAQSKSTYLVCEGDDALYVLDQHAAAERITFDRLRRAYSERRVVVQRLLLPEIVELSANEVAALDENVEGVLAVGLEVRAVGPTAVAVHGVPRLLVRARPEQLVRDLAAELGRAAGRPFGGAADLVLATMACHGSVRAGDALTDDEARALLRDLDHVDFAGHCPHGRPIVTRLAWTDLERQVGRR